MYEYNGEEIIIPECKYEYLDHTADMQLHAWGDTLKEAFEQCAMCMFGCITELEYVEIKETHELVAEGTDLISLLYHFLDEFLYIFCAEPNFIPRIIKITEFDKENLKITATGYGETFTIGKHPQGADVKAITYSNLQVHENEDKCEVFIIKITEFDKENLKITATGYGETFTIGKHPQGADVKAITYSNLQVHENEDKCEVFVIIDV